MFFIWVDGLFFFNCVIVLVLPPVKEVEKIKGIEIVSGLVLFECVETHFCCLDINGASLKYSRDIFLRIGY